MMADEHARMDKHNDVSCIADAKNGLITTSDVNCVGRGTAKVRPASTVKSV